ncbi:MAG: hypothetical protein MUP19_08910, partial [Candidatus Aminicenantes bacterium]|nr:hypothetical protein [Candidatus Aminicenantes bacterium]
MADKPGRCRGGTVLGAGLALGLCVFFLTAGSFPARPAGQEMPELQPAEDNLLKLLGIPASEETLDYVMNKSQFQLHTLLTEQRHPKTMNLSEKVRTDMAGGLQMLFSVDDDVAATLDRLAADPSALEGLAAQVSSALLEKRKIYIYGCGAT